MQLQFMPSAPKKQLITICGPLNASEVANIRHIFDFMATTDADELTVDMSQVNRLDASGVGALVYLFKRLKNVQRTLKIVGVHGQPEAVIRLLRLEKAIDTEFLN